MNTRISLARYTDLTGSLIFAGVPLLALGVALIFIGVGIQEYTVMTIGIFLFLLSFLLLTQRVHMDYDSQKNEIHISTYHVWLFKKNRIISLTGFDTIVIKSESSPKTGSIGGVVTGYSGGGYRHYTVGFRGKETATVYIREFSEYGMALKFQRELSRITGIQIAQNTSNKRRVIR